MLYFSCLMCHQFCDLHNRIATAVLPVLLAVSFGIASVSPQNVHVLFVQKISHVWRFRVFCASKSTVVLVVGATMKIKWWWHETLWRPIVFFSSFLNQEQRVVSCLVRVRALSVTLSALMKGWEHVPSFFPLCLVVCVLLSLKGTARCLKDRSPSCSLREAGIQRHHSLSSGFAVLSKPEAQGPWGNRSGRIQFSPRQLHSGKLPCWQPGHWGQLPIEFPGLENVLRKEEELKHAKWQAGSRVQLLGQRPAESEHSRGWRLTGSD